MSVIVKGMKMPKTCGDCPLRETGEAGDMSGSWTYWMDCKRKKIEPKVRPTWCPLVEYKEE